MLRIATLQTGFTVGEIAGFIAGAISVLQTVLPLIFAIVLLGLVLNGQHNPATWSAISHQLQSTLWPFLLRGDGSAAKHVRLRVQVMSALALLGTLCLTLAAFLTPRPLNEHVRALQGTQSTRFTYAPDLSFYGQGTSARLDSAVHRICGALKWTDCPNTIFEDPGIRSKYPNYTVTNSTIPSETTQAFINTNYSNTIASPMDIQYRNFYEEANKYIDDGEINVRGILQPLETFLLDNRYRIIEGLVVDAIDGGIGFRNHTAPVELELGAEWNEDLLWITPETACTSVNLSLHFSISKDYFSTTNNGYMTDDGGFATLNPSVPVPRLDESEEGWQDAFGETPDLQQRSYALAWWNNQLTARALNVSTSSVGTIYTNGFSNYAELASPSSIHISEVTGWYINSVYYGNNTAAAHNFTSYGRRCSGFNDTDSSNSSKPYVRCGYFYGVPYPSQISNGQTYRFDLRSNWTQQLYTCASAIKASIKTVTFGLNATAASTNLSSIEVLDIQPKDYSQDSLPVWGVERADGFMIEDINLFWGLVDESRLNSSTFEIRRAEQLYLPAASQKIAFGEIYDSFAAGNAFSAAWNSVYSFAAAVQSTAYDFIPRYLYPYLDYHGTTNVPFYRSYSGESNYGLTLKYRNLSRTPEGAANIMNLIWTDLAAFATVGTKTGFEDNPNPSTSQGQKLKRSSADPSDVLGQRDVHRRIRIIEYTNILYAIPAALVALLFLLGSITACIFRCRGIVSLGVLKHYINQTSMGRTATQMMTLTVTVASTATTKEWSKATKNVRLEVPALSKVQNGGEGSLSQDEHLLQNTPQHQNGGEESSFQDERLPTHHRNSSASGHGDDTPSPAALEMHRWPSQRRELGAHQDSSRASPNDDYARSWGQ